MQSWLTNYVKLIGLSLIIAASFVEPRSVFAGPSPKAEFVQLEYDMEEAVADFYDAFQESLGRDGQLKKGAKLPHDGRPVILKKMDALAKQYADKPDGGYMAANTLLWSVDLSPQMIFHRFTYLVEHYTNDPALDLVLEQFENFHGFAGSPQDWAKALRDLAKRTTREQTKFSANFYASLSLVGTEQASQAKPWLREVLKTASAQKKLTDGKGGVDPDLADQLAAQAKGLLFEVEHLQVGMPAPDFATKTFDGKPLSLSSLHGKVVLVDFWATWCPNCVAEFPHLEKVQQALSDKPFVILSVSLDESGDMAKRLVKRMKAPGIHTWDIIDGENPVGLMYNVRQLPTWYLLDQKGIIRMRDPKSDKLVELVEALLKPSNQ